MSKLIAVIDDEPEMEYIYNLMFESAVRAGMVTIKFFVDSWEFLQWYKRNEPDLIMTDLNMPNLSGLELTRALRKMGCAVPIYFVSGYEEKDYAEAMRKLGVCRFLSKPLNSPQVLGLIELDLYSMDSVNP